MDRVTRTPDEARASYDRLSRWYDLFSGAERRVTLAGLERLAVQPGESILEIGPGTGHALVALARAVGASGQVCGVDLSTGMLHVAGERLARADLAERVALVCGDGAALPVGKATVEAILLAFTLELFDTPEIPVVLAECRRVLKPGGRLGVIAMALTERPTLMSRLYAWAHRRWPRLVDCRPIPVQSVLRQAGFAVTFARHASIWGLPVTIAIADIEASKKSS